MADHPCRGETVLRGTDTGEMCSVCVYMYLCIYASGLEGVADVVFYGHTSYECLKNLFDGFIL